MTGKNLDTFDSETGKIIPLKVSWLKQDTMFLLPVFGRWKPECCVPKAAVAHTMTMGYGVKTRVKRPMTEHAAYFILLPRYGIWKAL